ncbi:hypothetical protein [Nocardia sputorum]|uniref:Uncharacterized protein n=1 Tax=Nocardia sputorum TaxID=2984338 RepID=A0ABM8CR45_9NOCA|nr:hypothetical protein [Nocardia sputorum]BDT97428.1 hypothetical protein IFM12276_04570 [Nocardia sputorum]
MTTGTADATFDFLLCSTVPLVLAPLGPWPPTGARLRGVVRPDSPHARIALSVAEDISTAVALDFDLVAEGGGLDVGAAVDHLRFTVAPAVADLRLVHEHSPRDSHGNVVVAASETGFGSSAVPISSDQRLFSLFSLLVHGGGIPWFEDLYTFAGFMFTDPRVCRIYLRMTATGLTYGVDLPLVGTDGRPMLGFSNLPQELAPLVRNGDLATRRVLDDTDDYCTAVVDLGTWLGPAGTVPRDPGTAEEESPEPSTPWEWMSNETLPPRD